MHHPLTCHDGGSDESHPQFYTADSEIPLKESLSQLIGDWLLFCPQFLTADILAHTGTTVYQYLFDFLSPTLVEHRQHILCSINAKSYVFKPF